MANDSQFNREIFGEQIFGIHSGMTEQEKIDYLKGLGLYDPDVKNISTPEDIPQGGQVFDSVNQRAKDASEVTTISTKNAEDRAKKKATDIARIKKEMEEVRAEIEEKKQLLKEKEAEEKPLDFKKVLQGGVSEDEWQEMADASGVSVEDIKSQFGVSGTPQDNQDIKNVQSQISNIENEISNIDQDWKNLQAQSDRLTSSMINNIRGQYEQKIRDAREMGRRTVAQLEQYGIRGGASRRSASFAGIVSAEERAVQQEVNRLTNQMNSLINEAEQAEMNRDFAQLSEKMDKYEELRKEKIEQLKKLQEDLIEKNEKIQEENQRIKERDMVIELYNQGVINPFDILNELTSAGYDIEPDKIKDILDLIPEDSTELWVPSNQEKGKLEQEFGGDWMNNTTRQQQLDFLYDKAISGELERNDSQIGKVVGITGKTPEEVKDMNDTTFWGYLYGKIDEPREFQFSYDDMGRLIKEGLTTDEINQLQIDLNKHGLNPELLENSGLTEEQMNVLSEILETSGANIYNNL